MRDQNIFDMIDKILGQKLELERRFLLQGKIMRAAIEYIRTLEGGWGGAVTKAMALDRKKKISQLNTLINKFTQGEGK